MNLANTAQGIFARVPPISCLDSQQDIIRYLVQNSGLLQLFIRVRSAILFISFWAGVIIAVGKKVRSGRFRCEPCTTRGRRLEISNDKCL
jgi:hypothetical protein